MTHVRAWRVSGLRWSIPDLGILLTARLMVEDEPVVLTGVSMAGWWTIQVLGLERVLPVGARTDDTTH